MEKIEYKTETITPAIIYAERKENEEFYSWLESEFNMSKEEYFNLYKELKDMILNEFQRRLKS
jgi:hypothetical protein